MVINGIFLNMGNAGFISSTACPGNLAEALNPKYRCRPLSFPLILRRYSDFNMTP